MGARGVVGDVDDAGEALDLQDTAAKKYSFATQPQRLNFTGVLEPKPTAREIGAAGSACIFRPALLASSASVFFFLSVICKKQRQCRCGMHNPTQECTVCAERVCMVQMLSIQTVCCMLHVSVSCELYTERGSVPRRTGTVQARLHQPSRG